MKSVWVKRSSCSCAAATTSRVAVPDVEAADAAREVDEGVAVDVGERRAARRGGDDRERERERARDGALDALADLPRARARNLGFELDRCGRRHAASVAEAHARIGAVVLSDSTIARLLGEGRIEIDPYEPSLLQPSSVDVRVDRYFRVFRNNLYPFIDVKQPSRRT